MGDQRNRIEQIQHRLNRSGADQWKPSSAYDEYGYVKQSVCFPNLAGCETFTVDEAEFIENIHDDTQYLIDECNALRTALERLVESLGEGYESHDLTSWTQSSIAYARRVMGEVEVGGG